MKKAFTIPETLIIVAIIGIIAIAMITTIKPNEKVLSYQYYNAYNTLTTAMYNINLDVNDAVNSSDNYYTEADKKMPETARELCERLAVDKDDLNSKYGYINTIKYNCKNFTKVPQQGINEFTDKYIAFQASNSMFYYISDPAEIEIKSNSTGDKLKYNYFIVWVNLNGEKRPNKATSEKKSQLADIIPFVVTNTGNVVPIGMPTVDKRYMSAQIEIQNSNIDSYLSESMTFYEAVIGAYGGKYYPEADLFSAYKSWENKLNQKYRPQKYPTASQLNKCQTNPGEIPSCVPKIKESIASF